MFCPKCGTKNPDNGKYCRKCGIDLGNVTNALSGMQPNMESVEKRKNSKSGWENEIGNLFRGFGFIAVFVYISTTGKWGNWWVWLLIPAFGIIGSAISKIISVKNAEKASSSSTNTPEQVDSKVQEALPPKQTEFVSEISGVRYETGDLVPPSVVENTTRHLEMDKEGKTMTLPNEKL